MTATATFAGTVLPDCFVGVPYLAGLPVATILSANISAVSIVAGVAPPGLSFNNAGYVTGTVQVTSQSGAQLDGAYTFGVRVIDSNSVSVSASITMNVHYLQADQDLTVAAQAALRAGEEIDNTAGTMDGVSESGVFPTAPAVPTDIG
jgi:hypothetical protein